MNRQDAMPMTNEKVRDALRACAKLLGDAGYPPTQHPEAHMEPSLHVTGTWTTFVAQQAHHCAREAAEWYVCGLGPDASGSTSAFRDRADSSKDRREKAMRWLGFCQGVVLCLGLCSLEDLKRQSMPDGEEYRP
jgi:hypothetical protein